MRYLPLLFLLGCFRDPDVGATPLALRLNDLSGVAVSSDEAPRDLELSLSFSGAPELSPVLMRGYVDASLIARLSFSKPNAALTTQLVPVQVERAPHALRIAASLSAGRYTLIWPHGEPQAFPFTVSSSPALGARWVESMPGDGASNVPANLSRALVRFDGHVQGALASALQLDGINVSVERCSAYGLPEGDCAWLRPEGTLSPGTHTLRLEPGLHTPGGASIPAHSVTFQVADVDRTPPQLDAARCALDERALAGACMRVDDRRLLVHGATSEMVAASLIAGAARAMALSYAGEFSLAITPKDAQGSATLRLTDLAGNVSEVALSYELARDLGTLAIDELRPDPLGKEPAQEYVELLNFGTESVSLMGFTLSTDAFEKGRTIASSATLAPGERALLVGPDFDPRDASDGLLPSGVRVIALSGALSLSNAGASVWLRDARGRRVAEARATAALVEGQCSHRIDEDFRAPAYELDAFGGCTPGGE